MGNNIEAIFLDVGNTLRIVIEDEPFQKQAKIGFDASGGGYRIRKINFLMSSKSAGRRIETNPKSPFWKHPKKNYGPNGYYRNIQRKKLHQSPGN